MSNEPENQIPPEFSDQTSPPPPPPAAPPPPPRDRKPGLEFGGGQVGSLKLSGIEDVYRLANGVARAGWAPKHYLYDTKNPGDGFDVDKIALGMIFGMELGFTPLSALRVIAVINGMPTVWGDGVLALCQSTGLMESFEENPILAEADAPGVKKGDCIGYEVVTVRKGHPKPYIGRFTREEALKAKLINKSGPWTEYPSRMYNMRARSWSLRAAFADRLNNLMMAEEAMDVIDGVATEVARPQIENKPQVNVSSALDAFSAKREPVTASTEKGKDEGHNTNSQG